MKIPGNINEKGISLSSKYTYSWKLQVTAYFDQFFFPWLKYRVNATSHGTEILGRLKLPPSQKISFYGKYGRESKDINFDMEASIWDVVTGIKQNYLLNIGVYRLRSCKYKIRSAVSELSKRRKIHQWFCTCTGCQANFLETKGQSCNI